jgi:hypothetical protein
MNIYADRPRKARFNKYGKLRTAQQRKPKTIRSDLEAEFQEGERILARIAWVNQIYRDHWPSELADSEADEHWKDEMRYIRRKTGERGSTFGRGWRICVFSE